VEQDQQLTKVEQDQHQEVEQWLVVEDQHQEVEQWLVVEDQHQEVEQWLVVEDQHQEVEQWQEVECLIVVGQVNHHALVVRIEPVEEHNQ
jgi:hypothetical protein